MSEQLTARAAVFAPGELTSTLVDVEVGPLRDDEVLVRLTATGVCHTDLGYRARLPIPMVLGHEGAGHVERVGAKVTKVKAGDAVVLSFTSCGHCANCEDNAPGYCDHMPALNQTGVRGDGSSALSRAGGLVGGHFFGQSSFSTFSVAN